MIFIINIPYVELQDYIYYYYYYYTILYYSCPSPTYTVQYSHRGLLQSKPLTIAYSKSLVLLPFEQ